MKLDQYKTQVTTSGIQAKKMTIQSSGKAFRMLLDRIYEDIKLAIVRELMTNGYDAQKQAGKPERAMEIRVPSRFSSTMSFRDFGISMTHDVVENVFSSLTASSKDDDDSVVGGFGIGSKTPFGYTDNLTFICYLDGEQRTYHMYLDAEGIPNILLTDTSPTTEENGILISFEVKPQDCAAFEENIRQVSRWFDVVPKVNRDINLPQHHYEAVVGDKLKRVKNGSVGAGKGFMVRQGCVAYPIEFEKLNDFPEMDRGELSSKLSTAKAVFEDLGRNGNFLDVEIGTVNVTASRDALYYDKKTCLNILNILCDIYKEVSISLKDGLAACKTLYEARRYRTTASLKLIDTVDHGGYGYGYHRYNRGIVGAFFRTQKYQGHDLSTSVRLHENTYDHKEQRSVLKYPHCQFMIPSRYSGARERMSFRPVGSRPADISFDRDVIVVLDQLNPKTSHYTTHRARRMALFAQGDGSDKTIIWVQCSSQSLDGFKKLLSELGNPPYMNLADVEIPKVAAKDYVKRDVYRYFTPATYGYRGVRVVEQDEIEKILVSGDFYVMDAFRTGPDPRYKLGWPEVTAMIKHANVADLETPVILVTKTTRPFYAKHIKNNFDFIEALTQRVVKNFDVDGYCELVKTMDQDLDGYSKYWTTAHSLNALYKNIEDLTTLGNPLIADLLWLYRNKDSMKKKLKLMKDDLDTILGFLDDDNRARLRRKIELKMQVTHPRMCMSMVWLTQTTLEREYPWIGAMSGYDNTEDSNDSLIALINSLTLYEEKLKMSA